MSKVAIMTDSNSGITQKEAKKLGVYVIPMPFLMGDETYYEDINLTQEGFYEKMENGCDISTSQPSPEAVLNMFDELLKEYDGNTEIVFYDASTKKYCKATGLKIDVSDDVLEALKDVLGKDNVILK